MRAARRAGARTIEQPKSQDDAASAVTSEPFSMLLGDKRGPKDRRRDASASRQSPREAFESRRGVRPLSGLGVGRLAPLARAAHHYAIDPGTDQDRESDDEDERTVRAPDDPVDLDVAQIDECECEPYRGEDEAGDQTCSVAARLDRRLVLLSGRAGRFATHPTSTIASRVRLPAVNRLTPAEMT